MKRRHQVNRDLLLPAPARRSRRAFAWTTASVVSLGLTAALAFPIMAQTAEDRQGNIPVAIDGINDPNFFIGAVQVDEHAPLAVFGGSGKALAIDGRPVEMLEGAAEQDPDSGQETNAALLSAQVGTLGVLPGNLQLMHPVTTRKISSAYGWRKNPTGPGNQIHIGQDYPISCGSPVYAAEAGRVIVSGWHGHSGNRVTVDHGHKVHTGYSHNSKLMVRIGDEVQQGQLIALAGTTGNSTGCHVHFEVIVDGRWHDPRNYLPRIPGQPDAMIDSSRLTVNSNSAPGGNGGSSPRPNQPADPDVVTPEDDTPVIPKPKPTPTAPKETESKAPKPGTPTPPTNTPGPTETGSPVPENSESTTPSPTEQLPSPTESNTPDPEAPTDSQEPSGSAVESGEGVSPEPTAQTSSTVPTGFGPSATTEKWERSRVPESSTGSPSSSGLPERFSSGGPTDR